MGRNNLKQVEGTFNKDKGELILWKGLGSYNPTGKNEYEETLIDFVDHALYPIAGLCQMLNRIDDESDDTGLSSVIKCLMHNARSNIDILTDFLEMTLGKISLKIQGSKYVYTGGPDRIIRAIVFKPSEQILEYLEIAKDQTKKLRAVSGDKR